MVYFDSRFYFARTPGVVYASATAASEPRNMAYMVRLGMWGQGIKFTTFKELSFRMEACKY
jgi:hypothetical protein